MPSTDLNEILTFLRCNTPKEWIEAALNQPDILLIDHAHCEKKAALSAIHLAHHYGLRENLAICASRLAREELKHFEQVLDLLKQRNISFVPLSPSRYAAGLRQHLNHHEPERLIDLLIISALIEARSCERFYQLVPHLDQKLAAFYDRLFVAEARHFQLYLSLAHRYASIDISKRVCFFAECEAQLIRTPDTMFRFHSGLPISIG